MQLHGIQVRPSKRHKHAAHAGHKAHASKPKMKFFGPHAAKAASKDERHDQLTEQTQKWVAQTFFGQMFKQMRDSPFKSKLFDGGRGGEAFQQMADERTAESMARGAGHKLVDAIVDRIEHPSTTGPAATATMRAAVAPSAAVVAKATAAAAAAASAVRATGHDWGHA